MKSIAGTFTATVLTVLSMNSFADAGPGFDVVVLGARGGIEDGNLSAFMIAPAGDGRAVTCDAGSLVNGLRVADEKGVFDSVAVPADSPFTRVGYVLTERIKGYLISHAHWTTSPASSSHRRTMRRSRSTVCRRSGEIQGTYFNWEAWPNFGTGGKEPQLKKYEMTALAPGERARPRRNRNAGDRLSARPRRSRNPPPS